ncbi:rubrerythrin family protein [Actinoallomurus soli]|uniref:rubrerythrin family protein n=1 Tax=Actinoallomurus soli TaxID=2952535 RepID=UPI0020923817|nr:rubrerythrin family protein [Actinoallomurus soli]MCO5967798.1 rubrerythrin family protein [Actinoallomurus soli]
MRGEAFANASYRLYAEQARREGLPSVARLFERTADTELNEHFPTTARLSGQVKGDAANLRDAIAGERYESRQMYPGFAREAESAGETTAADRFREIAGDEAKHARAFNTALRVVESRSRIGRVPAAPSVRPVEVPAGPPMVRAQRTRENLDTALHGEALAYAKYRLYGQHAARPDVARLFKGTGEVELHEHLPESARLAGLVGTTHENLTKAIAGERYESQTMYPTFAERARAAGDTEAARAFEHNAKDEARHARSFEKARDRLSES